VSAAHRKRSANVVLNPAYREFLAPGTKNNIKKSQLEGIEEEENDGEANGTQKIIKIDGEFRNMR
jgi:hypothetical protein